MLLLMLLLGLLLLLPMLTPVPVRGSIANGMRCHLNTPKLLMANHEFCSKLQGEVKKIFLGCAQ